MLHQILPRVWALIRCEVCCQAPPFVYPYIDDWTFVKQNSAFPLNLYTLLFFLSCRHSRESNRPCEIVVFAVQNSISHLTFKASSRDILTMTDREKTSGSAVISDDFLESANSYLSNEMRGTVDDQRDMYRLGKHQQLRVWRRFRAEHLLSLAAQLSLHLNLRLLDDSHG
jgi:hypothetical protein